MCTHQRFITNKYTGTQFLAKCGKCEACLQEKAYKRAYRIKCEISPDKIALFVTLTYDRSSCPFVRISDLMNRPAVLNIYREHETRRVRKRTKHGLQYLDGRKYGDVLLGSVFNPDYDSLSSRMPPHLAYRANNVGVCYYPDIQLFKKRLFINLNRKYGFTKPLKIYSCSEYGETTSRPHFHLLIFCEPNDEALLRHAISEAWPFASHRRTERYTEIARDVANYISSYVNCGTDFHRFLSENFKTKHSYSKDFGMANKLFSLDSILQLLDRRDLSYLRGIGQKGKETYVSFPIPKYVINRYFPLFKGYSRMSDVEVCDFLKDITRYGKSQQNLDYYTNKSIDYSQEDLYKIAVRIENSFKKYCSSLSIEPNYSSFNDYLCNFIDVWKVRKHTCMRLWYEDNSVDIKYKYDNVQALRGGLISSPHLFDLMNSSQARYIDNPNEFPQNVNMTSKYKSIYHFRTKEKKVNNFIMAQNNYYF